MYASAKQVPVPKRRTARSHRFLLRFGIFAAALAAAFVIGTAAAQADDQNVTPDESAASAQLPAEPAPIESPEPPAESTEPPIESPEDDGIIEGDDGKPTGQDDSSLTNVTAVVPDVLDATAEAVEQTPVLEAAAPVVKTAARALRGVTATTDKVVGDLDGDGSETVENAVDAISQGAPPEGLPDDIEDTANGAVAPLLELVPGGVIPGQQTPGHDDPQPSGHGAVPSADGGIDRAPQAVALPDSDAARRAANNRLTGGQVPAAAPVESGSVAPAEVAATTTSNLGGDAPLNELLGGDHGVVAGGSGAGVADRATPASASCGDCAELVSDPVRTDARPHTAPVARPEFAPD